MRSLASAELARLLAGVDETTGPTYARLAGAIRLLVLDGRLPLEVRLPGERDLAAALGVSRTTVTGAYDALRAAGYATSRQGAGTWTTVPGGGPPAALAPWAPADSADVLDLAHASPEAPARALRAAYDHALTALPRHLPGHGYDLVGLDVLREAIARRFTTRGLPTTPDQVLVTAGAQHAFSLVLELLVEAGDRVLTEHPTYPNALDAVRRVGAKAVVVALAETGWDVGAVSAALRQTAPRLAYLVPDFHNPTGLVASPAERRQLARAFAGSHTTVVVDETLAELGFDDDPPRPFATYDSDVITIGSASKTFWGGLRIGWVRADQARIRRLAAIRASVDNASPIVEQLAVTYLLDHADDIVPGRRRDLRERRDVLIGALARALPAWTVREPAGGLAVWCDIAHPVSSRLAAAAHGFGLRLAAGPRFGLDGAFERRLRLPYTHDGEVLERAVGMLATAYHAVLDDPRTVAEPTVDTVT